MSAPDVLEPTFDNFDIGQARIDRLAPFNFGRYQSRFLDNRLYFSPDDVIEVVKSNQHGRTLILVHRAHAVPIVGKTLGSIHRSGRTAVPAAHETPSKKGLFWNTITPACLFPIAVQAYLHCLKDFRLNELGNGARRKLNLLFDGANERSIATTALLLATIAPSCGLACVDFLLQHCVNR
jgi:hypothetical protein